MRSVKVTYEYLEEDDVLYIYVEGLPPFEMEDADWAQLGAWGIDVLVDSEELPRKYDIVRLGDLYPNGVLQMPPGYVEPAESFQLEEAPGRFFTFSDLVDWIHRRMKHAD